jgi:hypothetical protein
VPDLVAYFDIQVLHLKDLNSTHGTFLRGDRLKPHVSYAVQNGDVATFGSLVTSGSCELKVSLGLGNYANARSSNVSGQKNAHQLQLDVCSEPILNKVKHPLMFYSNPTPDSSPASAKKSYSNTFQTPYEDSEEGSEENSEYSENMSRNEDLEQDSGASDPVLRPSDSASDISEILFVSSRPLQGESLEPFIDLLTPQPANNLSGAGHVDVPSLPGHVNSGSSQENPIDLENNGASPVDEMVQDVVLGTVMEVVGEVIDSSDDEEPESLPIKEPGTGKTPDIRSDSHERYPTNTSNLAHAGSSSPAPWVPGNSKDLDSTDWSDNSTDSEAESRPCSSSDGHLSDPQRPYGSYRAWAASYSGDTREEAQGMTREAPPMDIGFPSEDNPGKENQKLLAERSEQKQLDDREATDDESEEEDESHYAAGSSARSSEEPSLDHESLSVQTPTTTQAKGALAPRVLVEDSQNQATTNKRSKDLDTIQQIHRALGQVASSIHRAPSPSDAALVKPAVKPNENFAATSTDSVLYRWYHDDEGPKRQSSGHSNNIGAYQVSPYNAQSISYGNWAPYDWETQLNAMPRYSDGPFASWSEANPAQQSSQPFSTFQETGSYQTNGWTSNSKPSSSALPWNAERRLSGSHQSRVPLTDLTSLLDRGVEEAEEQPQPKTTRLPISDIMNNSSSQDHIIRKVSKRKVDEMLSSDVEPKSSADTTNGESSQSTHLSILPDAQPREDDVGMGSISQEPSLAAMSQLEESGPVLEPNEPARKKVRTLPKASRPVKAFMSGVLVGAISLAGACAAFVATIPESVKNDALRDFL